MLERRGRSRRSEPVGIHCLTSSDVDISGLTDQWILSSPRFFHLKPRTTLPKSKNELSKRQISNQTTPYAKTFQEKKNAQNFLEGCVAVTDQLRRESLVHRTEVSSRLLPKQEQNQAKKTKLQSKTYREGEGGEGEEN